MRPADSALSDQVTAHLNFMDTITTIIDEYLGLA
jgi:hypothetical protein